MAKSYHLELNHKANAKGKYTLFLRISENRKSTRTALGYAIAKKDWNEKSNSVRLGCPDKAKIEQKFRQLQHEMQLMDLAASQKSQPISIDSLKARVTKSHYHNFYDFAQNLINRWNETKSVNHVKHVKSVILNLKKFSGDKVLNFEDFNIELLKDLEAWYYKSGNESPTVANKLKNLRFIFKEAEEANIVPMENNPFRKFKLPKGKSGQKVMLNPAEIKKIVKLSLEPGSLIYHVRNAFLFSFYNAGIRVGDLILLKWENIKNEIVDKKEVERVVLKYRMRKNGKWVEWKMRKEALAILDLYYKASLNPKEYIFPFFCSDIDYSDKLFLDNQLSSKTAQINENLKRIALKAKIDKPLSSHIARHTFASLAVDKLTLNELSKLLNHSNIKTTGGYINEISRDRANDALSRAF